MSKTLDRRVDDLLAERTPRELALGWLRYETVRKMPPGRFKDLWNKRFFAPIGVSFDDLVDLEILKK